MIHVSGNPIESSSDSEHAGEAVGPAAVEVVGGWGGENGLAVEMERSCNLWSLVLLEVCVCV